MAIKKLSELTQELKAASPQDKLKFVSKLKAREIKIEVDIPARPSAGKGCTCDCFDHNENTGFMLGMNLWAP